MLVFGTGLGVRVMLVNDAGKFGSLSQSYTGRPVHFISDLEA